MLATVGATKHGYDALNKRNVFRKIARREGNVVEGQWRRVVELRLQFINALQLHQLHLQGGEDEDADMMIGDITFINYWRWDYENQLLVPFEDMVRTGLPTL